MQLSLLQLSKSREVFVFLLQYAQLMSTFLSKHTIIYSWNEKTVSLLLFRRLKTVQRTLDESFWLWLCHKRRENGQILMSTIFDSQANTRKLCLFIDDAVVEYIYRIQIEQPGEISMILIMVSCWAANQWPMMYGFKFKLMKRFVTANEKTTTHTIELITNWHLLF